MKIQIPLDNDSDNTYTEEYLNIEIEEGTVSLSISEEDRIIDVSKELFAKIFKLL